MQNLVDVIFFRILRTTVYSTISLTFCAWIVQSSRYIWILNNNSIDFAKFVKFTSYLSVDIVSVILPIALAISSAFVYQRFNESNQLIALQAAGFSPKKMFVPLARMIFLVISYLYVSNFYISPSAWKEFRLLEFQIRNNLDPPEKAGAIFSKNGFSIYAQKYIGSLFFGNLFIIDARNPEKTYTYFAKSGTVRNNTLMLTEGERIEIDFKSHKNSVMHFQSYNYSLSEILNVQQRTALPNEKYIDELLCRTDQDESTFQTSLALLHQKITSPLLAGIFAMLAFLLILLAPYTRKYSNRRVLILVAIVIVIQGTYFWIANGSAKNLEFIKLNYFFVAFFIVILSILILRKRNL